MKEFLDIKDSVRIETTDIKPLLVIMEALTEYTQKNKSKIEIIGETYKLSSGHTRYKMSLIFNDYKNYTI